MPFSLSVQSRWEVIQHLAPRYRQAPRAQKTHLLNACVPSLDTLAHSPAAAQPCLSEAREQHQRASLSGEAVLHALLAAWTAANPLGAKRLESTDQK